MAHVQRSRAECPLCRADFPATAPLSVNHELRDLVALARALTTHDCEDGWQAVTAKVRFLCWPFYRLGSPEIAGSPPPLFSGICGWILPRVWGGG